MLSRSKKKKKKKKKNACPKTRAAGGKKLSGADGYVFSRAKFFFLYNEAR
jgi:hypothetical protein